MLISTTKLLNQAQNDGYAVGAFNVYTLKGVRAVTSAAETLKSPVMLQVLSSAVELGGSPLIALCLEACHTASVPMAVHLDHCRSGNVISMALGAGISSVMADGSHLTYADNVAFTQQITTTAHEQGRSIEAEVGRLSGTEMYLNNSTNRELVDLMTTVIEAMQLPVREKIQLFGSSGRAG